MSRRYAFGRTARGFHHIQKGIPCEDASLSFTAEEERYSIAAVADGHGAKACFRSGTGSEIAVQTALQCLREFAEAYLKTKDTEARFYEDILRNERYRNMTVRQLTDTIVARWNDRVMEDYAEHPPAREEIERKGADADAFDPDQHPALIYGTTLIAALWMPGCLLIIQQGDGRCNVVYPDGSFHQPVPWDPRCDANVTTSMCDEDAAQSFRSCVIDLGDTPVTACLLGSDGVEDAYGDTYAETENSPQLMGGVYTFFKDLLCSLSEMEQEDFEHYLQEMLPVFSERGRYSQCGSGDDVSVAGIADIDAVRPFTQQYRYEIRHYDLEARLAWVVSEIQGKTRKHGILEKRMNEAQQKLEEGQRILDYLEDAMQHCLEHKDALAAGAEQARADLFDYRTETDAAKQAFANRPFPKLKREFQDLFETVRARISKKEDTLRGMEEELALLEDQISQLEGEISEYRDKIAVLGNAAEEARTLFGEYDEKYRYLLAEQDSLRNELDALEKSSAEPS